MCDGEVKKLNKKKRRIGETVGETWSLEENGRFCKPKCENDIQVFDSIKCLLNCR